MSSSSADRVRPPPPARRIFCNRTLNLRSIRAVGFDMDYTLVHYHVGEWERRAYAHARSKLQARGWPVEALEFDPAFATLGLVLDLELGNVVKANRYGYVLKSYHGTQSLPFEQQRELYSRVLVDLEEPRWVFLNTLFSLSTATLYAQLVDLLDAGKLDAAVGYVDLLRIVRRSVDHVHTEGELKRDIAADPDRYVVPDPELGLTLLDLKHAGKQLLLITNSEWSYTQAMMRFILDPQLPAGTTWRDVFDVVIVEARKPGFFSLDSAIFEIANDEGLLRPHQGKLGLGAAYHGGSASVVERSLGLSGEQILYVGDHIAADVRASKDLLRWRTALVLRELESEIAATDDFAEQEADLTQLMGEKTVLEERSAGVRLQLQRLEGKYGPRPNQSEKQLRAALGQQRSELAALDERIAPLARAASELHKPGWGPLLRAGNSQSHLARQIERSADIYTSRVSNLLYATPFAYLRGAGSHMAHETP